MSVTIHHGDCIEVMRGMEARSVQCCVTSPPYYGLRDYGVAGQIGLEGSVTEYVGKLVQVFAEVRRVLADDGTLWLNLGDSYSMTTKGAGGRGKQHTNVGAVHTDRRWRIDAGLKSKDIIGVPWRVAFALQADGWYLRSDIIWHKPNPMPESVKDRPTKAHEYLFLLAKSERYFFDAEAIKEPATNRSTGNKSHKYVAKYNAGGAEELRTKAGLADVAPTELRNSRSVWTVTPTACQEAHFATMPHELARRCIAAGSRVGDVVLDPFGGSGTTGLVAQSLGRRAVLIDLNPEYVEMARTRIERHALPLMAAAE